MNPQVELDAMISLFPGERPLIARAEHIASALTPEPYKQMIVHDHHMTVTMEAYHKTSVDVKILERSHRGHSYARKILLTKSGTNQVVQFGIVRFDLSYVTDAVRDQIVEGNIPLGRVLINHNVLRHIDLGAVLRITAGPELADHMSMELGEITYGRMATIFCNHKPAVDLLEISAPLT